MIRQLLVVCDPALDTLVLEQRIPSQRGPTNMWSSSCEFISYRYVGESGHRLREGEFVEAADGQHVSVGVFGEDRGDERTGLGLSVELMEKGQYQERTHGRHLRLLPSISHGSINRRSRISMQRRAAAKSSEKPSQGPKQPSLIEQLFPEETKRYEEQQRKASSEVPRLPLDTPFKSFTDRNLATSEHEIPIHQKLNVFRTRCVAKTPRTSSLKLPSSSPAMLAPNSWKKTSAV
ncbi:Uu.00g064670.m01.CDS01 [Anthostomella pinea]|uniref:Uu.00g064670.m01.CDS01 n=1 Tax=Anthostomella pinea TaxID=933095 RepID=A0AAI8VTK8_9PEZI|nr:Uu.00g064670.m01.CDS01 [Anthostomella pinea]